MSGRLVILRHKSWNVWNGDNIEKVMKDERLHRENEEAKRKNIETKNQEYQLESLKKNADAEGLDNILPFRLFDEHEAAITSVGNAEYLKEKTLRDLKDQKDQGCAPVPLGDPSQFCRNPWYTQIIPKELVADTKALDRTSRKFKISKYSLDPASNYLKFYESSKDRKAESSNIAENIIEGSKDSRGEHFLETRSLDDVNPKESKKHKSKDRKNKRNKDHQDNHHSASSSKHHSDSGISPNDGVKTQPDDMLQQLRKRRLDRENFERKKAMVLCSKF